MPLPSLGRLSSRTNLKAATSGRHRGAAKPAPAEEVEDKELTSYLAALAPESDPESTGTGGFYDVLGPNNYVVEKGSFAKLRELSVSYKVGPIAQLGDWTVGIVGRNIATITKYSGYDPEVGCGGRDGSGCGGSGSGSTGSGLINQTDAFSFPTLRSWTFSLSTRF